MTGTSKTDTDPAALVRPAVQSAADKRRRLSLGRRALGPLLLVSAWAASTSAGLIDPSILPSPRTLGESVARLWTEQALPHQIGVSLARAAVGGFFGAITGLVLGMTCSPEM